jgi:hypothetical protein
MLTNSGSISLGGKIFMQGDEGTDLDGGGNGGDLTVLSAGALTLSAEIEATGAPPDGQGGEILFVSVLDTVQTGISRHRRGGGRRWQPGPSIRAGAPARRDRRARGEPAGPKTPPAWRPTRPRQDAQRGMTTV